MGCKGCTVSEVTYTIRIGEIDPYNIYPLLIKFCRRRGIYVEEIHNGLKVRENGAKEVVDFCRDFLNTEFVKFSLDEQIWHALDQFENVLSLQWIDNVIKEERIVSYSQPIVNRDLSIVAYEVLSRFENDEGQILYPNEVFRAAKLRGRLYALDRLCRMASVTYAANLNKLTFINFIPTSIYSPEFCLQSTIRLSNKLNIPPSQFVFEVVETEQIEDVDHLKTILSFYELKGFKYALDDVGEGFSTIELLGEIKPHYMKLDMNYVQGIAENAQKQNTAKLFLQKAIELGSVPLAEGIERAEDYVYLKNLGYELFQGYLFGKPSLVPTTEIELTNLKLSV